MREALPQFRDTAKSERVRREDEGFATQHGDFLIRRHRQLIRDLELAHITGADVVELRRELKAVQLNAKLSNVDLKVPAEANEVTYGFDFERAEPRVANIEDVGFSMPSDPTVAESPYETHLELSSLRDSIGDVNGYESRDRRVSGLQPRAPLQFGLDRIDLLAYIFGYVGPPAPSGTTQLIF